MSRRLNKPSKRLALSALASAPLWLVAQGSHAEPSGVSWRFRAPNEAGCPSSAQLRSEIARLSEWELADAAGELQIEALALVHEGSWVASVALRDAQGRVLGGREVSGPYQTCAELQLPIALVVATLLDELARQPEPVSSVPASEPEQSAAPAQVAAPSAVGMGAFVSGAVGLAPYLALGVGAGVELPLAWPLALSASVYLPGREVDAQERGARVISFHGGAAVCPRLAGQRHLLRLCGDVQAGAVVGSALGLDAPERASRPMLLLGLAPQLALALSPRWALQTSLGAYWLPVRPRFHWEIEGEPGEGSQVEAFALIARIGFIDFLR